MAALGLNPAVYLEADPALEVVLGVVLEKAVEIQAEWRHELAVLIVNQVAKSLRLS